MSGRTALELKKEILKALNDGKSHSYALLERKVNSNWKTIRAHCQELEIFNAVSIEEKKSHASNKKPYFEITITSQGRNILKKL